MTILIIFLLLLLFIFKNIQIYFFLRILILIYYFKVVIFLLGAITATDWFLVLQLNSLNFYLFKKFCKITKRHEIIDKKISLDNFHKYFGFIILCCKILHKIAKNFFIFHFFNMYAFIIGIILLIQLKILIGIIWIYTIFSGYFFNIFI